MLLIIILLLFNELSKKKTPKHFREYLLFFNTKSHSYLNFFGQLLKKHSRGVISQKQEMIQVYEM